MPVANGFVLRLEALGWDASLALICGFVYELGYEVQWLKEQTCLPLCHISLKTLEEGQGGHGQLGLPSPCGKVESEHVINNKDI